MSYKGQVIFLADLYKEGYKYQSINAYRLAISLLHERVDGYTVGQDSLVSSLMRGVFNDRPPVPCYTSAWNVQTYHIYLHGELITLSLKQLSWKTAMLLALTRPSRLADLSQLKGARY